MVADTLVELQRRHADPLNQISQLAEFRAGCVTELVRRCGKPGCRCSDRMPLGMDRTFA